MILDQYGKAQLGQALRRSCDYHRANLRAAGFDDLAEPACDEMGDVTSIGEQYITHQSQERTTAPLWVAGLGAALATGVMAWILTRTPEKASMEDTDTRNFYGFSVGVEQGGALPGKD